MTIVDYKEEIIAFVTSSSDADNLMLATFIAGMQSKKGYAPYASKDSDSKQNQTSKPA